MRAAPEAAAAAGQTPGLAPELGRPCRDARIIPHPSLCDPPPRACHDVLTGGCEAPLAAMEPPWLQRLDRPCRLLLHVLCGRSGPLAALRLLQRAQALQGPGPAFSWQRLIAALCAEEPALEGPEQALAV